MPLAYYSRGATSEFWSEHWGGHTVADLLAVARRSPLTDLIERPLPDGRGPPPAGRGRGAAPASRPLGVVEHGPGAPDAILAEAARVLAPGGVLLLSVPYRNGLRRLLGPWLARRSPRIRAPPREICQF